YSPWSPRCGGLIYTFVISPGAGPLGALNKYKVMRTSLACVVVRTLSGNTLVKACPLLTQRWLSGPFVDSKTVVEEPDGSVCSPITLPANLPDWWTMTLTRISVGSLSSGTYQHCFSSITLMRALRFSINLRS